MFDPVAAGHSIVVAGAWNNRIFTPPWIERTFNTSQVEIAISPLNVTFPLRLKFDGIYLQPGGDRIVITPVQLSDNTLIRMQSVAETLLTTLSHTPISGTGINLRYLVRQPSPLMVELFNTADRNGISDVGGEITSPSIRRLINTPAASFFFSTELKVGGHVAFELNFHKDTQTPLDAIAHLSFGLTNFQSTGLAFLNSVYQSAD